MALGRNGGRDRRWPEGDGDGVGLRVWGGFLGRSFAALRLEPSGVASGFVGYLLEDGRACRPVC